MPGKIWTGTLSFVLVSIPIELVSAVSSKRLSFRLMHKSDNGLLKRQMYCPQHKKYVHSEHIVNGYEVAEDKYVIVRDEEYNALEPKRSQSIEIESFIDASVVPAVYFDRPYYLLPGKGGLKAYQMLHKVMLNTSKAGIAQVVFHTRQHLVLVKPGQNLLQLMTLHYYDQIRKHDHLLPDLKAQPAEVKSLTVQIKKLKGKYQPDKYIDDHRQQVLEFLEEKVKQGSTVTIEQPEEEEQPAEPETQADLIAALEESLSKVKSK